MERQETPVTGERREATTRWDLRSIILSFLIASIVESLSLYLMFSNTGHAGSEGRFATAGWLATAMNLPGLFFVGILQLSGETPTMKLAAIIYVAQMPLVWGLAFILIRLFARKLKKSRAR